MKIGLLLEGGGMRGLYTAGVLDVLMDNHIAIEHIVGVSAGTLFGVNYMSNQRGRAIRYNKQYVNHKQYISLSNWLRTGNMINKEFVYYTIPMTLDIFDNDTYKNASTTLHTVITNVDTGKAEYVRVSDVFKQMEVLRATSALPFVSKMVNINGREYLDGGISDSIPIDFIQTLGVDKIVVVLTQPKDYEKTRSNPLLNQFIYRKYPNLVKALNDRHINYNSSLHKINELENQGDIFVIRPSEKLKVKRLEKNPDELEKVYQLGIADTTNKMDSLKQFLIGECDEFISGL